jgi:NAD-dependent deacetylase
MFFMKKPGSKNLIHMHGELFKTRCMDCSSIYNWHDDLFAEHRCINCSGQMRPHIVWFNEMPIGMDDILLALNQCDLFISIGTSGSVYPAAGFYQMAAAKGAIP